MVRREEHGADAVWIRVCWAEILGLRVTSSSSAAFGWRRLDRGPGRVVEAGAGRKMLVAWVGRLNELYTPMHLVESPLHGTCRSVRSAADHCCQEMGRGCHTGRDTEGDDRQYADLVVDAVRCAVSFVNGSLVRSGVAGK